MVTTTSTTELIRQSKIGRVLNDSQVRRLADITDRVHRGAGSQLFAEGSMADAIWLVCCGRVAIEIQVPGRADVCVLNLEASDIVGWSSLCGDGRMTASAVVTDDAWLLRVPINALKELCLQDHTLGYAVMGNVARVLAERLTATRQQLLEHAKEFSC